MFGADIMSGDESEFIDDMSHVFKKKESETKDYDVVNHPQHYAGSKIEVIDYIEDKELGYCLGNVIKYVSRAGKKYKDKEVEDLKKAQWYLERRIKELTKE